MKISLTQLRRIIREVVEEEAGVPGKWFPYDGEPVDQDDLELMATGGLGKRRKSSQNENTAARALIDKVYMLGQQANK